VTPLLVPQTGLSFVLVYHLQSALRALLGSGWKCHLLMPLVV
jgi:hypothetical protein